MCFFKSPWLASCTLCFALAYVYGHNAFCTWHRPPPSTVAVTVRGCWKQVLNLPAYSSAAFFIYDGPFRYDRVLTDEERLGVETYVQ